jgi:cell wall-associated NlpC family hydrolase
VDAAEQLEEDWTLHEKLEAQELQKEAAAAMTAPLREGEAVPPNLSTGNQTNLSTGNHTRTTADHKDKHTSTLTQTSTTRTSTTTVDLVSPAPLYEFYMYRANSAEGGTQYEFGNINTGNLDGVVWYLQNEVVTLYSHGGPQCPRKFDISQINRYKVKTRATKELFETGVNFGVRWAYDFGICMGRCFPGNKCTGGTDCDFHFDKFGYTVGCNNFYDNYPFPDMNTPAKYGIWYALPLDGRCEGTPTGARNCTWSYEEAGIVNLTDVEATNPNGGNCCDGGCTSLWDNPLDQGATDWRVQTIRSVFAEKFPDMPEDLGESPCDFYPDAWYAWGADTWAREDQWAVDPDLWMKKGQPMTTTESTTTTTTNEAMAKADAKAKAKAAAEAKAKADAKAKAKAAAEAKAKADAKAKAKAEASAKKSKGDGD